MENKVLIKTNEAAAILNCTKRKLEADRVYNRGLPFIRIGRSVRYDLADIKEFIAAHRIVTADSLND